MTRIPEGFQLDTNRFYLNNLRVEFDYEVLLELERNIFTGRLCLEGRFELR